MNMKKKKAKKGAVASAVSAKPNIRIYARVEYIDYGTYTNYPSGDFSY